MPECRGSRPVRRFARWPNNLILALVGAALAGASGPRDAVAAVHATHMGRQKALGALVNRIAAIRGEDPRSVRRKTGGTAASVEKQNPLAHGRKLLQNITAVDESSARREQLYRAWALRQEAETVNASAAGSSAPPSGAVSTGSAGTKQTAAATLNVSAPPPPPPPPVQFVVHGESLTQVVVGSPATIQVEARGWRGRGTHASCARHVVLYLYRQGVLVGNATAESCLAIGPPEAAPQTTTPPPTPLPATGDEEEKGAARRSGGVGKRLLFRDGGWQAGRGEEPQWGDAGGAEVWREWEVRAGGRRLLNDGAGGGGGFLDQLEEFIGAAPAKQVAELSEKRGAEDDVANVTCSIPDEDGRVRTPHSGIRCDF